MGRHLNLWGALKRLEARLPAVPRLVGADGMALVRIVPRGGVLPNREGTPKNEPKPSLELLPPNTRRMTEADHERLVALGVRHIWIPDRDDRPIPDDAVGLTS